MDSFVTFYINDQIMGLNMLNVERIIKFSKISSIPNSDKELEGIINVEDELIPAINLKRKFNLSSTEVLPQSSVLVIISEKRKVGIIVDDVDDIIEVNEKDILKTLSSKYVYGVVKVNNIISLLDSNALMQD